MIDFTGKTALVTGASVGIGRATAEKFAENHANLVLLDMDYAGLERAKQELAHFGVRIEIYECDVSDEAAVKRVCADALKKMGKIEILVNNAGIWRGHYPFLTSDSETWRRRIGVNILGTMYCTQALLGQMIDNHYGRIINIGSVAGIYGNAGMVDYSMTKGAVAAFTVALAKEVAEQGVLVNCVSPGNVNAAPNGCPQLSFMNRSGSYRENANLICFLASDEASFIAGQQYVIDGCRKKM